MVAEDCQEIELSDQPQKNQAQGESLPLTDARNQPLRGQIPSLPFIRDLTEAQLQQLSPSALAYLGDAVYELYVRCHYLIPAKRIQLYHQQVVAQVRAEQQADHLRSLLPYLTSDELAIVKRGRNAATGGPRRTSLGIYQQASGLETLLGYLYLTDGQRLSDLLTHLKFSNSSSIQ